MAHSGNATLANCQRPGDHLLWELSERICEDILKGLLWLGLLFWTIFQTWSMLRSPVVPPAFAEHDDVFIPPRAGVTFQYAEAVTTDTRDFWQKPDQVLDELGDLTGASVADIG